MCRRQSISIFFIVSFLLLLYFHSMSFASNQNKTLCHEFYSQGLEAYKAGKKIKALQAFNKALTISKTIPNYKSIEAVYYREIGVLLDEIGQNEEGINKINQAIELYKGIPSSKNIEDLCIRDKKGLANSYVMMSVCFGKQKKHNECLDLLGQAIKLYRKIPSSLLEQADCYSRMSESLCKIEKYKEAIERLQKAIEIYKKFPYSKSSIQKMNICDMKIEELLQKMTKENGNGSLNVYTKNVSSVKEKAHYYLDKGNLLLENQKYTDSITKNLQALKLFNKISGSNYKQAKCYMNIAMALSFLNKNEESIKNLKKCLEIYKEIKETTIYQAIVYRKIGLLLNKDGRYMEAIETFEMALNLLDTNPPDTKKEKTSLLELYAISPDNEKTKITLLELKISLLELIEKLVPLVPKLDDINNSKKKISKLLYNDQSRKYALYQKKLAESLFVAGYVKDAVTKFKQFIELYQADSSYQKEIELCYLNLGSALIHQGQCEEGIAYLEHSFKLMEKGSETNEDLSLHYYNLGLGFSCLCQNNESIRNYNLALEISKKNPGGKHFLAFCYNNLAKQLMITGNYKEALDILEESIHIEKTYQATFYMNIGIVYNRLGIHEKAIKSLKKAKSMFINNSSKKECNKFIGEAYLNMGKPSIAIDYYNLATTSFRSNIGRANAYRLRGALGDEKKAIKEFVKSIYQAENVRISFHAFEHQIAIFEDYYDVFPDFVNMLIELHKKKYDMVLWSYLWEYQDNVPKFIKHKDAWLLSAFYFSDRGKGRALEDALRQKSLISNNKDLKLLELDNKVSHLISKKTLLREELPYEEILKYKELTKEIEKLQHQRNMIEVKLKKSTLGDYIKPEFSNPLDIVKKLDPETAIMQYSLGSQASWLLILTTKSLSAYLLEKKSSKLLKRSLQKDTISQLVELWKKQTQKVGLDRLVRLARIRVEDIGMSHENRHNLINALQEKEILEHLGRILIPDSALFMLRQAKICNLLIIPDGFLNHLSFAMLRVKTGSKTDKSHYLVEDFSISYINSMTTLNTIRKQKQKRGKKRTGQRHSLLAFANPYYEKKIDNESSEPKLDDMFLRSRRKYYKLKGLQLTLLNNTEREALNVASLFPQDKTLVYTGKQASEKQVKKLLEGTKKDRKMKKYWKYLLFSTHGLADMQNGMLSCLFLSAGVGYKEDGFLQAQEILNFQLDTDLVMLSACQTGLGEKFRGEGLLGLSTAFFYAGSESVCASLWKVPTGPTEIIVTEFFKHLNKGKISRAEALRQSQLSLLRYTRNSNEFDSSPFYWAAFILMGEYN